MPNFPHIRPDLRSIGGSVFSDLAHRIASYSGKIYPLHIGDTWMQPPKGCRMEDLSSEEFPALNRYGLPQGEPDLIEALVESARHRFNRAEPEELLVTAGATGGLAAVAGAIISPGDRVLVAAPYWPLIAGILRSVHAEVVPIPLIGTADSADAAIAAFQQELTSNTVAIYLSSPNNPTGRVLPQSWIEALARWTQQNELWLLADEVYEHFNFISDPFYARSIAPENTFSAHSFSKGYGMAGYRCGWVAGPSEIMSEVSKISTHSFYSTPTASPAAALRALGSAGDRWVETARDHYQELGRYAADKLKVPPPEGSTFLFLDVAPALDHRGLQGFLEDAVDQGLLLAPGPSFGPYPTHIRVCFTCAEPETVREGVDLLVRLLSAKS